MYRQTSIPMRSQLRSLVVAAAFGILQTSAGPAAAGLWPRGAVPRVDGCNQRSGYPVCRLGRPFIYQGRSAAISVRGWPYATMPTHLPEVPDFDNR